MLLYFLLKFLRASICSSGTSFLFSRRCLVASICLLSSWIFELFSSCSFFRASNSNPFAAKMLIYFFKLDVNNVTIEVFLGFTVYLSRKDIIWDQSLVSLTRGFCIFSPNWCFKILSPYFYIKSDLAKTSKAHWSKSC